jgi:hypothetical protein
VLDGLSADQARVAEIDENLIRADLTPSERAVHHAERKALYLKLHPETKHGGAPGKAGGGKKAKDAKLVSFVKDTAKKTGKAKRTIARDVGQQVMAVAMMYPEPEKGDKGKRSRIQEGLDEPRNIRRSKIDP